MLILMFFRKSDFFFRSKIVKQKLDYTMSAIVGLAGLQPTIDAIKFSRTLALANKETIICAWPILNRLKKKI